MNGKIVKALRRKLLSELDKRDVYFTHIWREFKRDYLSKSQKQKHRETKAFRKPIDIKVGKMGSIKYL